MALTMQLPDYDRSSLSVTASLFRHFGGSSAYPTLPELDARLREGGINKTVLLLTDGFGEHILRRHLPESSFLVKNDAAAVSAVYPSTTTAATTAIWTGASPIEHGWLGWSLYFKECAAQLDTFIGTDDHTGVMYPSGTPAPALMPLPKMPLGIEGLESHLIFPFNTEAMSCFTHSHVCQTPEEMLSCAAGLCAKEGRRLIDIYYGQPDSTMHKYGVDSPEAKEQYRQLNRAIELFASSLPKDTLLIVTADHGLIDTTEAVHIEEIPEIDECLWMPPSIEGRAAAFYVKGWRRVQFERAFQKYLGEDFELYTSGKALQMGLFGRGTPHKKAEDFMGDYIACAKGTRYIVYKTIGGRFPDMIGHHAGLTPDEMTVPVILYRNK